MITKFVVTVLLLLVPVISDEKNIANVNYNYIGNEINDAFSNEELYNNIKKMSNEENVIKTYNGPMTAYGPDCYGCSGITASGYDVKSGNIYYNDKEYGNIRILASDKVLPFGTIVRIKGLSEEILAIVLDRGSAIGFNKKSFFDLLYKSEYDATSFGYQYATFEILRLGY